MNGLVSKIAVVAVVMLGLAVGFWWFGSSYVVMFRAAQIAGDRPYCLSVAGSKPFAYDEVTSRRQLAFAHMWAGSTNFGGSMGDTQTSNHALLVLSHPPAVMNWSYKVLGFVREPMMSNVYDPLHGFHLASAGQGSCTPRRLFADTLGW